MEEGKATDATTILDQTNLMVNNNSIIDLTPPPSMRVDVP